MSVWICQIVASELWREIFFRKYFIPILRPSEWNLFKTLRLRYLFKKIVFILFLYLKNDMHPLKVIRSLKQNLFRRCILKYYIHLNYTWFNLHTTCYFFINYNKTNMIYEKNIQFILNTFSINVMKHHLTFSEKNFFMYQIY